MFRIKQIKLKSWLEVMSAGNKVTHIRHLAKRQRWPWNVCEVFGGISSNLGKLPYLKCVWKNVTTSKNAWKSPPYMTGNNHDVTRCCMMELSMCTALTYQSHHVTKGPKNFFFLNISTFPERAEMKWNSFSCNISKCLRFVVYFRERKNLNSSEQRRKSFQS